MSDVTLSHPVIWQPLTQGGAEPELALAIVDGAVFTRRQVPFAARGMRVVVNRHHADGVVTPICDLTDDGVAFDRLDFAEQRRAFLTMVDTLVMGSLTPSASPEWYRFQVDGVEIERPAMSYSDALEIVHDLAQQVVDGLPDDHPRAAEIFDAVNQVEDLVTNHHEEIDERYQAPGRVHFETLPPEDETWSDLRRALAMVVTMAEENILRDDQVEGDEHLARERERQIQAVSVATDFVGLVGPVLEREMTTLDISPLFDDPTPG